MLSDCQHFVIFRIAGAETGAQALHERGGPRVQSLLGFLAAQNRAKSKWGHFPVGARGAAGPGTLGVSSIKGHGEGEV